jgi:hypothetical protein
MMRKTIIFIVFVWICGCHSAVWAETAPFETPGIFQQAKESLCQVRVIDLSSLKKLAIGTGFQISPEGWIVTNYHVIADVIHNPELYRLELYHEGISAGGLSVLDVDVVHDLAILRAEPARPGFLELGNSKLEKGNQVFSLGNPFDYGMSVVEGTYNGLMERTRERKILFSGSLNPGMSGGPAMDQSGRVIGINVSTQGDDISFLVPVEYLTSLVEGLQARNGAAITDWHAYIESQLVSKQDQFMESIINEDWECMTVGRVRVPGEINETFKCWAETRPDNDKEWIASQYVDCSSPGGIFVSSSMVTGKICYHYTWMKSKGFNPVRFYNSLQSALRNQECRFGNVTSEDDATNFECTSDFIRIDGHDCKATFCARNYKKYPQLYDVQFQLVSVDKMTEGLLLELKAKGVTTKKTFQLLDQFLNKIKWQE